MVWNKTPTGYNMFDLLSALQKDIRRGNEEEALHWADHLEKHDYAILWNRLEIIASEDIGIANPNMPVIIRTLRRQYEDALGRRHDSYRVFLSNAIINLCRSKKSRIADDLLWKVYCEIEYENKKLEIPEYAKDHHTGKNDMELWINEGSKIYNESKIVNPYSEKSKEYLLKHKKLPKIFPKRRRKKGEGK